MDGRFETAWTLGPFGADEDIVATSAAAVAWGGSPIASGIVVLRRAVGACNVPGRRCSGSVRDKYGSGLAAVMDWRGGRW